MENESQVIQVENNRKLYHQVTSSSNIKNNKVILLQLLNLIFIGIFYFTFLIIVKSEKRNSFWNKNINTKINTEISNSNSINNLSKKIRLLKILTNNDVNEYKGMLECLLNDFDNKHCIYHLILPKQVVGKNRILLGKKYDGCYVLLDDFNNIKIAYSFGISRNIQFDKALADKGIDVYMYDHTINSLPYENKKFHWKKIGLCGKNTNSTNLTNLEQLIYENGHSHEKNMILKMDIEYWEWESIIGLKEETLNQFKYIAIEYHFKDEKLYNNHNIYYKVLKKISRTHQSFYARCNADRSKKVNFGNNRICKVLEVSYIIKKDNKFIKDDAIYPIYEFDYSKPKLGKLETNLNILKLFDI